MGENSKNVAKVASITIGSRVLGLVRDIVSFAYLGAGAVNSAFLFAYAIPNLLRRMMGEGALASAMVPVFSKTLNDKGKENAFAFLNRVLTRAGAVLILGVLLLSAFALAYEYLAAYEERHILGARFTAILMPYGFFICIAALMAAVLNVLGIFALPAMGAIWLNVSMITSLILGGYFAETKIGIVYWGCAGILLGGIIQYALPLYGLRKSGWRFKLDFSPTPELTALFKLFLPALFGAAVVQFNILISKFLGMYLNDYAVSIIYLSSRLLELPLGIFTIAIATVYFPKLSMLSSGNDSIGYVREYKSAMNAINCISIPAALGLCIFSYDILSFLFEWGAFKAEDVSIAAPVLMISALSLPAISVSTIIVRGFYSKCNTKTPVYISLAVFVVNLILSLLLIALNFGVMGLALANTVAAVFHTIVLRIYFKKHIGKTDCGFETLKIFGATLFMCAIAYSCRIIFSNYFDEKYLSLAVCLICIPLGGISYFAFLKLFNFHQLKDFKLSKILR